MSVVVETGSGNINADSYVNETDLESYATARGITLSGDSTSLLIQAMDYLESLAFVGYKYRDNQLQNLQWPRADVWVDGWYCPVTTIPIQLPKAQCSIACAIDAGNGPLIDLPRKVSKEKVGDLEIDYEPGSNAVIINRIIVAELHKLLVNGGVLQVSKA